MRYVDEFRSEASARALAEELRVVTSKPWTVMEICGGQTHTIVKSGLSAFLPETMTLVHGPGCPVCVTPLEMIDRAIALAARPEVILVSFGDMLRVPGSGVDLLTVKAEGGDIRVVYSPLDALKLAGQCPDKEIVFFAVGFETTAPATAMAIRQARHMGVMNFSVLCAHVLVPPAMEMLLSSPLNRVQGFLAAGHVCTVTGYEEYEPLAHRFRVPIVVTGFEPVDILQGLLMVVRQLEQGRVDVENQYTRSVRREGNRLARELLADIFEVADRAWRGIGKVPRSGYRIARPYADYDAEQRFDVARICPEESSLCQAGLVLQGLKRPNDCPAFGTTCTPERPLGAPMVSSEGACAAYYRYGRLTPGAAATRS